MEATNNLYQRYARQMVLPGFGEEAQAKLGGAKVLIVGAGGLGVPCMLYLAAAGVGSITIADGDVVALNNLHRQVLYTEEDLGKAKALVAAAFLSKLNSEISVHGLYQFADNAFCMEHIAKADIVVDCTDSLAARYCISDASHLLSKPYVYGAISRYQCQFAFFHSAETGVGYRSLFPQQPAHEPPNCAEQGVPGMLAGMAGCLQALEVLKFITGSATVNPYAMHTYDALTHQTVSLQLKRGAFYPAPANLEAFLQTDYGLSNDICSNNTIRQLSDIPPGCIVVDIREQYELDKLPFAANLHLPYSTFHNWPVHKWQQPVLLVCASGQRSRQALHLLQKMQLKAPVYHLEGGLDNMA